MRMLLLVLFAGMSLCADSFYTKVVEKSGAAAATTLQQPASPSNSGRLIGVQLYSAVANTFTLEVGQTATATDSSSTITGVPRGQTKKPTFKVYTASDAASGTVLNKYVLAAGETRYVPFDPEAGKISNSPRAGFTIRDSATGDTIVTWFFAEN